MAFFGFGKKEKDKMKTGLEKTRTGFWGSIMNTLTGSVIDDEMYDDLEEKLILADVGGEVAVHLVDKLRDRVRDKGLKTGEQAADALRDIIAEEMTPEAEMALDGKPAVILVIGVNGVGKTTSIAKLADYYTRQGKRVMLADLDIVNPYFRSRERKALLEDAGIRLICSSQACSDADVPALPAEVLTILENRDVRGVLDIGGDPVGARVLARFRPKILQEDHQLVYVLNANRPEVRAPENAIAYLRAIEATTGLTCGGIVNNTHLCGETTEHEIRKGADLAERVSEETGIPVLCHVAEERFADHLRDLREPVFPITIKMKKPWEL